MPTTLPLRPSESPAWHDLHRDATRLLTDQPDLRISAIGCHDYVAVTVSRNGRTVAAGVGSDFAEAPRRAIAPLIPSVPVEIVVEEAAS